MNSAVCDAIRGRRVLGFRYDGGDRTVEPHCHGVSTAGNEVLRAYQTAGSSRSGKPVGWKLFEVSKMSALQSQRETFGANRPDYNPNDNGMSSVHCNV